LRVACENQPLPQIDGRLPVVGVNSFGFGGTNAHVVLEAAPVHQPLRLPRECPTRPLLLPISAKDESSLHRYATAFADRLEDGSIRIADFCSTAGYGKEHHDRRLVVAGKDAIALRRRLRAWLAGAEEVKGVSLGRPTKSDKELTFIYTGQGAQWWAMGQQLLEREPVFRQVLDEIDARLEPLSGWSLLAAMNSDKENSRIERTDVAQPAIFALQIALTKLWESWEIKPTRVVGHSVGEVAAAYCAGIFSLEDAVKVIYHRSRLQNSTGGYGRMLAVGVSPEQADAAIGDEHARVQVAVINNPNLVTLAGDTEPLKNLAEQFQKQGRFLRWLPIDYAFHTHQMDPIRDELLDALDDIQPRKAKIPFISTVTAGELNGTRLDACYWWRNVREPVLFGPAIMSMLEGKSQNFLEIGPHPALESSLRDCLAAAGRTGLVLHSLRREADESNQLLENVARLHIDGFPINWQAITGSTGYAERLPTYPFARDKCWLETEASRQTRLAEPDHALIGIRSDDAQPTWRIELDLHRLTFLDDHRMWDSVVFPGAGYVEIGLAIARTIFPNEPMVVENIVFRKAMFVSQSDPSILQTTWSQTDRTFSIYSRSRSRTDWVLNATGRIVAAATTSHHGLDLDRMSESLTELLSREQMYNDFLNAGFQFGPNFQLLDSVRRGAGKTVGDVIATDTIMDQCEEFVLHPSILDACFQISAARPGSKNATDDFLLPASVKRIQVFTPRPPRNLCAFANLTLNEPTAVECDIYLVTHEGECVAEIRGFRAERAPQNRKALSDSEQNHYQTIWRPQRIKGSLLRSAPSLPVPSIWAAAAAGVLDSVRQEKRADIYCTEFVPKINAITPIAIQNAFIELGWNPNIGDRFTTSALLSRLGIVPKFERLMHAQLKQLTSIGTIRQTEESDWQVVVKPSSGDFRGALEALRKSYGFSEEIDLIRMTGTNLAAVLCGDVDPVHLLFPAGSSDMLSAFYSRQADFPCMHELIRESIREMVASLPPNQAIRVLEVGGGTASLTSAILAELPEDRTEYVFTDVGAAFLDAAKTKLAEYSFVDFKAYDLEKDASSQGFQSHSFDLILATDVLHATADLKLTLAALKSLLASDGVLLFVEVMQRMLYPEGLVFGLLDGWWRFSDPELRTDSPLLSRAQWHSLLLDCGFLQPASFATTPNADEAVHVAFVAQGPSEVSRASNRVASLNDSTFVAFIDELGMGDAICDRLTDLGAQVLKIRAGQDYSQMSEDQFFIDPTCGTHYEQVFGLAAKDGRKLGGVIHCWSADLPSASTISTDRLQGLQPMGVLSALRICQANPDAPKSWVLVDHVYQIDEADRCEGLAAAPLVGFMRVANNELYPTRMKILDLGGDRSPDTLDACVQEIVGTASEAEVAFRHGQRFLPRLVRKLPEELAARTRSPYTDPECPIPFRLESRGTGFLTNLGWCETHVREPVADEIAVRVEAGGINFRDVMKALGTYPGNPVDLHWYGDDFAGTVVSVGPKVTNIQIGDRVAGMAPYAFQSRINVDTRMVFRLPESMSFEQAATLPTVFLTAHYAILHLARMTAGESILIHGGTGGVGQAAIQIAKNLGLTIFATSGSDEKRQLLKSQGVHHVLNSRTLEFSDRIKEITGGKGVDAVLNSLAGEFIPKSLELLAPYGRFLEIGKIDVYSNSKLGMLQLKDNISYFVIDLGQHHLSRRTHLAQLFLELSTQINAGSYMPLPHTCFPISQSVDAFRFMAQGKHIGKNVLTFRDPNIRVRSTSDPSRKYRSNGSYLITGGAGGFCLELARAMVEQGARHLVLMSRSGPRDENSRSIIDQMRQMGANVIDARGDVTSSEDVQRVVAMIHDSMPPLVGVLHGAMLLDDEFISDLTLERFETVLNVKMLGGWNLHCATQHLPLEDFICFSSVSSILGGPRQSNYNAGNYFLDALAHYRHARGLAAQSIDWGAIRGAGFVERNQKTADYLEKTGMLSINLPDAIRSYHESIELDVPQISIAKLDWSLVASFAPLLNEVSFFEEVVRSKKASGASGSFATRLRNVEAEQRLELTKSFIAAQIASVFGVTPVNVDYETPITQMGLDSLMAIELKNRIEKEAAISLPMNDILSGPTLFQLAKVVLTQMDNLEGPKTEVSTVIVGDEIQDIEAANTTTESWSPIETFASPIGESPLFCLHPLGGDIQCYRDLARLIQERSIVPLRGRGGDGLNPPHATLSEMIADYLIAIRSVQASGPYHLAGWSAGGIFAYELARVLSENGEEVGSLTLFDTPLPSIYAGVRLDDDVRFLFDLGRFANWFQGSEIDVDSISYDHMNSLDEESRWKFAFDIAQSNGALPKGTSISNIRRVVQAAKAHAIMIRDYRIEPIDIIVNLVRPAEPDVLSQMTGQVLAYDLGWGEILEERLQLHQSPGDHFSMMHRENAAILAEILNATCRPWQDATHSNEFKT